MGGYKESEEEESGIEWQESRLLLRVLSAPVFIGLCLLVKGFSDGGYIMAGVGVVILVSVPIMIFAGLRRGY